MLSNVTPVFVTLLSVNVYEVSSSVNVVKDDIIRDDLLEGINSPRNHTDIPIGNADMDLVIISFAGTTVLFAKLYLFHWRSPQTQYLC